MLIAASRAHPLWGRIAILVAVFSLEALATHSLSALPDVWQLSSNTHLYDYVLKILLWSIFIFAGISWRNRAAILSEFRNGLAKAPIAPAVSVSVIALGLSFLVRNLLAQQVSPVPEPILGYIGAALDATTVAALSFIVIPLSFWTRVVRAYPKEAAAAVVLAVVGVNAGELLYASRGINLLETIWAPLREATIELSYWMLSQMDRSAFVNLDTRVLGAGDFSVHIYGPCSGYQGLILISAFLCAYTWLFRRSLRFPHALLLLPVAMAVMWLLNSFRIALLVLIGAHVSPAVALGGFHSQFGWICFLLVALTIMIAAPRIKFLAAAPASGSASVPGDAPAAPSDDAQNNPALLYLAPFIGLLVAQIIIHTASPHEQMLYPLKVFAIGLALYIFRQAYLRMWAQPSLISIALGATAGFIWIATDPGPTAESSLAAWIAGTTPLVLTVWLVLRAVGTIVMVPIAEELAFRGYLYRVLLSSQFEKVDSRTFGIVALVVSSALFGLMHDRWLAAALAGLLYALILIRNGRLSDAIAAHMTTNAVIFVWAVAVGQWSLL